MSSWWSNIKKRFLHYRVWGIHQWPKTSAGDLMFFVVTLNKLLNKQASLIWDALSGCLKSIGTWLFIQFHIDQNFTVDCFYPVLAFGYCCSQCLCVHLSTCQSGACPHDNLWPFQTRMTKFGPKVQNTWVTVPIVLGGDWPRPSRSNVTLKSNFTQFWASSLSVR